MSVATYDPRWTRMLGVASALFGVLILGVSSIPGHAMAPIDFLWSRDKLLHGAEYCVFAVLVSGALRGRARGWVRFAAVVVGCAAFGVVDELYQSTVPGRFSSAYDALADGVGALLGAAAAGLVWRSAPVPMAVQESV